MRKQWMIWALGGLALGALIGAWRRSVSPTPRLSRRVAKRLPIAKPLRTIPDFKGNHDIDGVSYDTEGVVVSGDYNKPELPI